MSKRARHFQEIAVFRQRFRNLSTEKLRERLHSGVLLKEAAIAIREILEKRKENAVDTRTIYVALLDEGVDVWRPVQGEVLGNGLFRIVTENADANTETWQFNAGEIVWCVEKEFSDGESGFVAVAAHGSF